MSSIHSLEKLPVETIQTIMIELADASALPALLKASPVFYQTFKSSETTIVNKLLMRQFGPDLLIHALAAFQSFTLNPQNTKDIKSFTDKCYTKDPFIPRINNLFEAINISKGHLYIQHFTSTFITAAFSKKGQTMYNRTSTLYTLSPVEITRIERSFYIFETYCNLSRSNKTLDVSSHLSDEEQYDLIFSKFAPWEVNQIGCIYTFLENEITPAFNDIESHDIGFTGISAIPGNRPLITIPQLLSRGLAPIYYLTQASTYSSRYMAIFPSSNSRHFPNNNLFSVLSSKLERPQTRHISRSELDITSSLFPDEDCGPSEAWLHTNVNHDSHDNGLTLGGGSECMREWGYVFWTYSRLYSWNFFVPPSIPPPPAQTPQIGHTLADFQMQLLLLEQQDRRRGRRIRRSGMEFSRKMSLFNAGGRGWWDKDDESQVVWPKGGPSPLDDEKARKMCKKCNQLKERRRKGKKKVACMAHALVLVMPGVRKGEGEEKLVVSAGPEVV